MMVTTHTMNQIIVYCFITLVVYADEIVRSDQKQGRVTFSSDFEFDDFDTQEKQNYEDEDFISQEFEQVKRDTKVIIEELEQLVVTVEGESRYIILLQKIISSNYFCIKGEALDEKRLMAKTAGIIKKKLGTKSLKELIKDEEFRNSIFHRFAVLKLPLRKGESSNG